MRWCLELVDFYVPYTIQLREYSRGGGTDGSRHEVFAVNVNWNSDNRKWNINDWKLGKDGKVQSYIGLMKHGNAFKLRKRIEGETQMGGRIR